MRGISRQLGNLSGAVERIAHKHVALNILPQHYPFVATALLGAIAEVLGSAATDEIMAAWGEAYWFLAEVLIGREASIYRDLLNQPGGWNGWREFVVDSVTDESSIIRSFLLRPADGGLVVRHKPGQYLGLSLDVPGVGTLRRNYSISCAPNDAAYRITVKRETASETWPGVASNWLHDHVSPGTRFRVAAPAGDFFLDTGSDAPVVLVSGGVGLTPLVSMLETIAQQQPQRPVWWVHGARNNQVHAMRQHVEDLARRSPGVRTATFYDEGGADTQGVISVDWLRRNTPAEAIFYLCGPKPFLRSLVGGLLRSGIPAERVRYEFFGPADELLDATEVAAAA